MKKVTLSKPIVGHHGQKITEIEFREPLYEDFMALGEPATIVETTEGATFVQEATQIIDQYAQRLLIGTDPNFITRLSLKDTLKVKQVITGFFREARMDSEAPSAPSPQTSSSEQGSTQVPSSA